VTIERRHRLNPAASLRTGTMKDTWTVRAEGTADCVNFRSGPARIAPTNKCLCCAEAVRTGCTRCARRSGVAGSSNAARTVILRRWRRKSSRACYLVASNPEQSRLWGRHLSDELRGRPGPQSGGRRRCSGAETAGCPTAGAQRGPYGGAQIGRSDIAADLAGTRRSEPVARRCISGAISDETNS